MGHRSTEKFCLRWNDFESNISIAFRELREEQDFFDVTLACDDEKHVEAHRVILSACSPFFRSVLRRVKHAHPLLYLKGVKHADLVSVLNFMYHGEVNVAQEELTSFLAVAEELKVKGLTQQNGGQTDDRTGGGVVSGGPPSSDSSSSGGGGSSSLPPSRVRNRDQSSLPDRISGGDSGPSAKRSRTVSSAMPAAVASAPLVNSKAESSAYIDDDIQEVIPVKSEPLVAGSESHALVAPSMTDDYSGGGTGSGGGQLVSDEYGEDYADYEGGGGYDGDGSYEGGGLDSSMGMGGAASADGNKAFDDASLDTLIADRMERLTGTGDGTVWQCRVCQRRYKDKTKMKHHIETHLDNVQPCPLCRQTCKTRRTLKTHMARAHHVSGSEPGARAEGFLLPGGAQGEEEDKTNPYEPSIELTL